MTPITSLTRMTAWLEQAWLARYLDRQLASEETTWFEAYVLDKPELLAMIDADTRFRDALADDPTMRHMERSVVGDSRQGKATAHGEAAAGEAGSRTAEDPRVVDVAAANDEQPTGLTSIDSHPGSRTHPVANSPLWFALAASLLAGVGVGWIGTQSLSTRSSALEIVANPTRIIFDTMRGEVTPPRVEHADSASPYVFVEVAVPPGAEHITLKMGDATEQSLTPSPDGFVNFFVLREKIAKSRDARIEYTMLGKETRLPIAFQ
jgi:hypothetical protein